MKPASNLRTLKLTITAIALAILLARIVFPDLRIDATSLALLAFAILPWLSPLVRSAELPGGFKIEFQDVKKAAEKVAGIAPAAAVPAPEEPPFVAIAEQDPNLALVGLRIEIEKRLRALGERVGLGHLRSLSQLTTELQARGVLEPQASSGLRDLIAFGNQAAHGAPVAPDVALSAVDYGPSVLKALDAKLIQASTGAA